MSRQDDKVEKKQCRHFGVPDDREGRSGHYIADSIIPMQDNVYDIEFKSCNFNGDKVPSKRQTSTSRVTNEKRLDHFSKVAIHIISSFDGDDNLLEHYLFFPEQLKPFVEEQRKKIREGRNKYIGMDLYDEVEEFLVESDRYTKKDLKKFRHTMEQQGTALNDPKISWYNYTVKHGTKIETRNDLLTALKARLENTEYPPLPKSNFDTQM